MSRQHRCSIRPRLEALEDRSLPSAGPLLALCHAPDVRAFEMRQGESPEQHHGHAVHSVVGSGEYEADLGFATIRSRETWAAFQDAEGRVWGSGVITLDFTSLGLGVVTFHLRVEDMEVAGDSAWIGGVVTHSTNEALVAVGSQGISLVRDLGSPGADYLNGSPLTAFPPGTTVHDRPEIPGDVTFLGGNFRVR